MENEREVVHCSCQEFVGAGECLNQWLQLQIRSVKWRNNHLEIHQITYPLPNSLHPLTH